MEHSRIVDYKKQNHRTNQRRTVSNKMSQLQGII